MERDTYYVQLRYSNLNVYFLVIYGFTKNPHWVCTILVVL